MLTTVVFQTIQFCPRSKMLPIFLCIAKNSIKFQSFTYKQLNNQPVLLQTIQFSIRTQFKYQNNSIQIIAFSISTHFSFIWPIDRTLSGATTSDQGGHGSDGNKGVFCIWQSSSISWDSQSDFWCYIQDTRWCILLF